VVKRGRAGDLGVRLGKEIRENFGRAPRPLRGERCGDDGSDPWGRPVSGATRASGGARHAEERSGSCAWAVLAQGGDAGVGRVARWRAGERHCGLGRLGLDPCGKRKGPGWVAVGLGWVWLWVWVSFGFFFLF
jgi:hypothetical protein